MQGWRREMYHDDAQAPVGDAVAQHADARLGHRLSRHGAVRGHERVRGTRHDAAVRARRRAGHRRRALRRGAESAALARRVSGRWCSSRRSTSTRRQTCGGCQIHVVDRRTFRPVLTGVALSPRSARRTRIEFRWREPPVRVRARSSCRSTSWRDRRSCGSRSRRACRLRRSRGRGTDVGGTTFDRTVREPSGVGPALLTASSVRVGGCGATSTVPS